MKRAEGGYKPWAAAAQHSESVPDYLEDLEEVPVMGAMWIFAVLLLPAAVLCAPASPSFSYPSISIDLPSIDFDIPTGNTGRRIQICSVRNLYSCHRAVQYHSEMVQSLSESYVDKWECMVGMVHSFFAAGSLSVQHAAGSPSVSYNGDSAVIQANLELSEGATCTLSRGDSETVSKDCKYL